MSLHHGVGRTIVSISGQVFGGSHLPLLFFEPPELLLFNGPGLGACTVGRRRAIAITINVHFMGAAFCWAAMMPPLAVSCHCPFVDERRRWRRDERSANGTPSRLAS